MTNLHSAIIAGFMLMMIISIEITNAFLPPSSFAYPRNPYHPAHHHHHQRQQKQFYTNQLYMSGKGGGSGTPAKPAESEEEDMELTRQTVTRFIEASQQIDTSLHDALDYRQSQYQQQQQHQHQQQSSLRRVAHVLYEKCIDYFKFIRWNTILQAVGAFIVGCLVTSTKPTISSILSVYLSYGVGMAMNDCVDYTMDSNPKAILSKQKRPLPSGRISISEGWAFVSILTAISLGLGLRPENNLMPTSTATAATATVATNNFGLWTASNLGIMVLYAMGLQKIFLLKNLIVGYLGISPLLGAVFLSATAGTTALATQLTSTSTAVLGKLIRLASVGMGVGVAREILKDIEDVDIDKKGGKSTVPLVVGTKLSHRIAYGIVWTTCFTMLTKGFRSMFATSTIPFYMISWLVGTCMIARATFLPLSKGQTMLKYSIYVLLGGMTLGLMVK